MLNLIMFMTAPTAPLSAGAAPQPVPTRPGMCRMWTRCPTMRLAAAFAKVVT